MLSPRGGDQDLDWGDIEDELRIDFQEVDDFQTCKWFHKNASRATADQTLAQSNNRSFLVRPSSQEGSYAVSMKTSTGQVLHAAIQKDTEGLYFLSGAPDHYPTITGLVQSLALTPLPNDAAKHLVDKKLQKVYGRVTGIQPPAFGTASLPASAAMDGGPSSPAMPTMGTLALAGVAGAGGSEHSGWLEYRGRQLWFVVQGAELCWYQNEKQQDPRAGSVGLANCRVRVPVSQSAQRHPFVIEGGDRMELVTPSASETRAWAHILGQAIVAARGSAPLASPRTTTKMVEKQGQLTLGGKQTLPFSLKKGYLMWFPSTKDMECKGTFPVLGSTIQSSAGRDSFTVVSGEGVPHDLKAADSRQANSWVDAIKRAMKQAKDESGGVAVGSLAYKDLAGWLGKKGKRRYFALRADVLIWLESEPKGDMDFVEKAKGHLTLAHSMVAMTKDLVVAAGSRIAQKNPLNPKAGDALSCSFTVNTPFERSYTMVAGSVREALDWVASIDIAIAKSTAGSDAPAPVGTERPGARRATGTGAEKAGWLTRKGKKKWYVLRLGSLTHFDSQDDETNAAMAASNAVPLRGCSVREDSSLQLVIWTPRGDVIVLDAGADRKRWLSALQSGIREANRLAQTRLLGGADRAGWLLRKGKRVWAQLAAAEIITAEAGGPGVSARGKPGKTQDAALSLSGASVDQPSSPANSFRVTTALGKRHAFTAADAADARDWLQAVQEAIAEASRMHEIHYRATKLNSEELMDIFLGDNFGILRLLFKAYLNDEVVRSALQLTLARGLPLELADLLIRIELDNSVSVGTLFRTDSAATKFVREVLKHHAQAYIKGVLSEHISRVLAQPEGYEVDPNKANGEDVAANARRLQQTCQAILDSVLRSASAMPSDVNLFAANTQRAVEDHFPGQYPKVIAGFLFLRFICPAIFSPSFFGLSRTPPKGKAQRALILIAKVLQNLANGVQFGKKEQFLVPLNGFVQQNTEPLAAFFGQLASAGDAAGQPSPAVEDDKTAYISALVQQMIKSWKQVETEAQKDLDISLLGQLLRFCELTGIDTQLSGDTGTANLDDVVIFEK